MKIQTLKDIKEALKNIPDELLSKAGVGYNEEGNMEVGIMYWGEDYDKSIEESNNYPALSLLNKWVERIAEMGENGLPDEPQEEAMYIEVDVNGNN